MLPSGVEALTGAQRTAEQQAEVETNLVDALTKSLLVFAFIALVVAAFSIFNTFSVLAAQRAQSSALLRALGASHGQVLGAAIVEAALVGLTGSLLGIAAGLGLASGLLAILDGAGFGLPTDGLHLPPAHLLTAATVGVGVTVASALIPGTRSAQVAPLAALRDAEVDDGASSLRRAVAGVVAAGIGVALVLSAAWTTPRSAGAEMARAGAGIVSLVVGLVLLGPVAARPVGALLGKPLALRGVSGELAGRNAVRNPRRTAATASALLIGVGVVTVFATFGASVKHSIDRTVSATFGGDLAIEPAGRSSSGGGLAPGVVEAVADLPEVDAATGLGFGGATLDGAQHDVTFTDTAVLGALIDLDVAAGDLRSMGDDAIAVSTDYAAEAGLALGERVEAGFADGTTVALVVRAVYDADQLAGDALVDRSLWDAHNRQSGYFAAFVGLADGTTLEEGRAAVVAATRSAGNPAVLDREAFIAARAGEVDAMLQVIYGLLGLAIVIAVLGIANTVSLSVHERRRELAVLRAIGQTRTQLRAMVRGESIVVATFGTIGGVGLGVFLGWGLVRALSARTELAVFDAPFGLLAIVLAAGVVVGLAAGARPAWRASRADVLAGTTGL